MRPIRMKLKGLNSFLEPQEIDFELLTSRGLFGIFGPRGIYFFCKREKGADLPGVQKL